MVVNLEMAISVPNHLAANYFGHDCTYLSSLNEVSLVIFLTGKLSASVRYSRHSSNFP